MYKSYRGMFKSYRVMFIYMLSCNIYQAMLQRIAPYFEMDNKSYQAMLCILLSDVNEALHDKDLHHSILMQYRMIIFYIA